MEDRTRKIGRDQVEELVRAEQAQLIDVLHPSAFEALHLPGAINIPLTDLNETTLEDLDRSHPIILYCYDDQ